MGRRPRNTSLHIEAQWAPLAVAKLDEVSLCDANLSSHNFETFISSDLVKVVMFGIGNLCVQCITLLGIAISVGPGHSFNVDLLLNTHGQLARNAFDTEYRFAVPSP